MGCQHSKASVKDALVVNEPTSADSSGTLESIQDPPTPNVNSFRHARDSVVVSKAHRAGASGSAGSSGDASSPAASLSRLPRDSVVLAKRHKIDAEQSRMEHAASTANGTGGANTERTVGGAGGAQNQRNSRNVRQLSINVREVGPRSERGFAAGGGSTDGLEGCSAGSMSYQPGHGGPLRSEATAPEPESGGSSSMSPLNIQAPDTVDVDAPSPTITALSSSRPGTPLAPGAPPPTYSITSPTATTGGGSRRLPSPLVSPISTAQASLDDRSLPRHSYVHAPPPLLQQGSVRL